MSSITEIEAVPEVDEKIALSSVDTVDTIDVLTAEEAAAAAATQEQQQPKKRIVLALPGKTFSDNFLMALVSTLHFLWHSGKYDVVLSHGHSSFVPFTRQKCFGASVLRGADQKPFQFDDGNVLPFDIFVTIDSDIVWRVEDFIELVESVTPERQVVSGYYLTSDITHTTVCREEDNDFFVKNSSYNFLKLDEIAEWRKETKETFMPVFYNGMGFMAIHNEVLRSDKLRYPWFWGDLVTIETPEGKVLVEQSSEDVNFCKALRKAGYEINVHTGIRVGHEKSLVI